MLLRHSFIYLLSRGVPGIIGFATVIIYTHLLSPASYGQYALVVTGAVIVNAVLYHWINASLLRFLPKYKDNEEELLRTLLLGFVVVSCVTLITGVILLYLKKDSYWRTLIILGVALTWAQAWLTLNLELSRSRLLPVRYGKAAVTKAIIALVLGVLLVWLNYGAYGALIGLLVGFTVSGAWISRGQWGLIRNWTFNRDLIIQLLTYGLPLTASFALTVVISSTDRFMIAALLGDHATGLYSAGQGLAQQTVGLLMTMINLAGYPLILKALENGGPEVARTQLKKNAILLLGIGLPVTAMFILLAGELSNNILGENYQNAAISLIPWFSVMALISSLRGYYFDLSFYLGNKTRIQMVIMTLAALSNVLLNLLLIPRYELMGAAYSSLLALGLAIMLSATLGRKAFPMPKILPDVLKLFFATAAMSTVLFVMPISGLLGLTVKVIAGMAVYASIVILFNIGDARASLKNIYIKWRVVDQRS